MTTNAPEPQLGADIKKLGFGLMRLPQLHSQVEGEKGGIDIEQTKQMVDMFLDAGFTYSAWKHWGLRGRGRRREHARGRRQTTACAPFSFLAFPHDPLPSPAPLQISPSECQARSLRSATTASDAGHPGRTSVLPGYAESDAGRFRGLLAAKRGSE